MTTSRNPRSILRPIIGMILLCLASVPGVVVACEDYTQTFHLVQSIEIDVTPLDLVVVGDHAFGACGPAGLATFDLSDPERPRLLTQAPTPASAQSISIRDGRAYLCMGEFGVQIFDVTDPSRPLLGHSVDTPGWSSDLDFKGQFALVADGSRGISIVDLSDPTLPRHLGTVLDDRTVISLTVRGELAYVGSGNQLEIYDLADLEAPVRLGAVDNTGYIREIVLREDLAFVAASDRTIQIVDVSDPTQPHRIAYVDNAHYPDTRDIAVIGNTLFAVDRLDGMIVVDVTDPAEPVLNGFLHGGADHCVAASEPYVYTFVGSRLLVYDATHDAMASSLAWVRVGGVYDLDIADDYLFAGCSELPWWHNGQFDVVDLSDPLAPEVVYSTPTFCDILGVAVSDGYAYLTEACRGLLVLDVSDPTSPQEVAAVDLGGNGEDVEVVGNVAYVATYNGFYVFDVGNPHQPQLMHHHDPGGVQVEITVVGKTVYVAGRGGGFYVYDVTNPSQPTFLGNTDTPGSCQHIAVQGQYAYIADGYSGLVVVDVGDPASPAIVAEVRTPYAVSVLAEGPLVYVGVSEQGVLLVDVSDPADPRLIGNIAIGDGSYLVRHGEYIVSGYGSASSGSGLVRILDEQCAPAGPAVPARSATEVLLSIAPSPANPRTVVTFELDRSRSVDLEVYDLRGRLVRRLASGAMDAGVQRILWDGRNSSGVPVASGVYLVQLRSDNASGRGRVLMLK